MNPEETLYSLLAWKLQTLDIKYFTAAELLVKTDVPPNSLPSETLLDNILPTVKILDKLRFTIKKPIIIISGYRNDAYNRRVGGSKLSQHKEFKALDFTCDDLYVAWRTLTIWRRDGMFKGGIGRYSTFIHLDTRNRNATWGPR